MEAGVVPAPAVLAGFAVLGGAVVTVPDWEPKAVELALAAYLLVLLTGGYLWLAGWRGAPALLLLGYLVGIALVKFVLSPASFHHSTDTTLAAFVWLGLGVMVLYLGALIVLYRTADRAPEWLLVAGVLVLALVSRYVLGLVLGRDADDYLADLLGRAGVWLLLLLAGSVVAAVRSFRRADAAASFRAGAAVIIVYHGLWALFMLRLFG